MVVSLCPVEISTYSLYCLYEQVTAVKNWSVFPYDTHFTGGVLTENDVWQTVVKYGCTKCSTGEKMYRCKFGNADVKPTRDVKYSQWMKNVSQCLEHKNSFTLKIYLKTDLSPFWQKDKHWEQNEVETRKEGYTETWNVFSVFFSQSFKYPTRLSLSLSL